MSDRGFFGALDFDINSAAPVSLLGAMETYVSAPPPPPPPATGGDSLRKFPGSYNQRKFYITSGIRKFPTT